MYANPRKTKSIRRLGPVDIGALSAAVRSIPPEVWDRENASKPNRFEALDKTEHVVFRFVDGLKDWRHSHDRPMWSQWKHILNPVLLAAVAPYGYARGEFPRVMLAKMAPGGVILPHTDASPSAKWPHKIHVPLQTNPGVEFFIQPDVYHLSVGEAVEVNNLTVHSVSNPGPDARIHLIFEYFDPEQPSWLDS